MAEVLTSIEELRSRIDVIDEQLVRPPQRAGRVCGGSRQAEARRRACRSISLSARRRY